MATDAAVEYSDATKELGDKLAELSLKEAKQLSDYLKDEHGIEPAAGGAAVVMAADGGAGGEGGAAAEEKTEFDVVLENFGDKNYQEHLDVRRDLSKGNPLGVFRPGRNFYAGLESIY